MLLKDQKYIPKRKRRWEITVGTKANNINNNTRRVKKKNQSNHKKVF